MDGAELQSRRLAAFYEFALLHLPEPDSRVLEVGCGDGELALALVHGGYSVTAIDPEAPEGAIFRRTRIEDFFEEDNFDAVVASVSLHHVDAIDVALDKIVSLLRPGGLLVLEEFAKERFAGPTARWYYHQRQALAAVGIGGAPLSDDFATWLRTELAPLAPSLDAVGEERYALDSRYFLGAVIDLDETYAWGFDELHRIQTEQRMIAKDLTGDDDIQAAYAALDADPRRRIAGAEAFRDWMQDLADRAVGDLAGTHFDIPDPIRRIECCIAPTHDGVIYYTDPTEDFSRPGRMWWAVPAGIDDFSTWKEVTTVYHEGVPGHHLQIAQNAYRSDLLNRWQRKLCFCSGHGEGWALYAERLMDELGYLEGGDRMGMLDAQAFRAIRVIIDIGMHLQLPIPRSNPWNFRPGERWTPAAGFEFLVANCSSDEPTLRFELDRYLGWPGQAPSYKVGERIWLEAREEAKRRKGRRFNLRQFHADALNLGSLGLDPLRAALARI